MEIENKGIVRNGFSTVVQVIVTTLAYFIIYPLLIWKLGGAEGKNQIGIWATITAIPAAMSIFGSGVSGCMLRYVPIYMSNKDHKQINQLVFNGLLFNFAAATLMILTGYFFSVPILKLLFSTGFVPDFYIKVFHTSLCIFFLTFINSVFLFTLDGLQLIYKKNIILIASSVIFCILSAVLISEMGLMGLLYAQLIQAVLIGLCSILVLNYTGLLRLTDLTFSAAHQKLFFTYGRNMQFISFSILLFDPLTKFFLNRYSTLPVVAMYEYSYRAVTQARSLVVSAIQAIIPVVSRKNEEKNLNVSELYNKAARGGALLSILGYSVLITLSITLIFYLDPLNMPYYLTFLFCLSLAYSFNIIASAPYSILMGLGDLKHIVISHLLSTGLNFLFFLFVGLKPLVGLMVLPPALSVFISSVYVLYVFKKNTKGAVIPAPADDLWIYTTSFAALAGSLLVYFIAPSLVIFGILNSLFIASAIYLVFRNRFLMDILDRLLVKK